jgi:hypothetical protein
MHRPVNCDALVVAWNLAVGQIEGGEQPVGNGVVGQFLARPQPRPQFGGRGKGFNEPLDAGDEVEFDDFLAIGGVGEFELQDFGVVLRLLQTVGGFFVFGLGLGDGDGKIAGVTEQVICAFALFTLSLAAAHDDPAIGETALLGDGMRVGVPARSLELRHDELPACIRFGRHNTQTAQTKYAASYFKMRCGETKMGMSQCSSAPAFTNQYSAINMPRRGRKENQ